MYIINFISLWLIWGKIYIPKKGNVRENNEARVIFADFSFFQQIFSHTTFGKPRVMGAIESLGCNLWKNMHQIGA